jgi:hypothetical protein
LSNERVYSEMFVSSCYILSNISRVSLMRQYHSVWIFINVNKIKGFFSEDRVVAF